MLKISALEIYNEHVRDLLNLESGSLRLLDDPEVLKKKFITEKLDLTIGFRSFFILNFTFILNFRKGQLWKN